MADGIRKPRTAIRIGIDHSSQPEVYDELIAWRRRQHLIFVGYSEAEIIWLGDLGGLTYERMNELIHSNKLEATEKADDERNKTAPDMPVLGPSLIDRHAVRKP
jgi:hypothetical protein